VEEIRNKIMAASKQCFVILDSVCERHREDEWVKILQHANKNFQEKLQ